jgi:hypothetical protein
MRVLAATLVLGLLAQEKAAPAGRVTFVSGDVERVSEGSPLEAGERLRTRDGGLVRAELAGMVLTLAGSSALRLDGVPLLESGRVEIASEGETVSLATEEARVRGGGRIVARRAGGRTQLMVLLGGFRVSAGGEEVALGSGQGTVIAGGGRPERPRPLAAPPAVVSPALDPHYVRVKEPVTLTWAPAGPVHLQVLPFDSPEAIVAIDADQATARVSIAVPGIYRWRVSRRDAGGGEGLPSTEGLICVVE